MGRPGTCVENTLVILVMYALITETRRPSINVYVDQLPKISTIYALPKLAIQSNNDAFANKALLKKFNKE